MDRFQISAAFIVCCYLGAVVYVLIESGIVDTARYRIKQRHEGSRKNN